MGLLYNFGKYVSPVGNDQISHQSRTSNCPKIPPHNSTVRSSGHMEVSLLTDVRAKACWLSDLRNTRA